MAPRWYSVVIDRHDVAGQARWRAEVGQDAGNVPWVVLVDPEGTQSCDVTARAQSAS